MDKEYHMDKVFRLENKDIKVIKTWPREYGDEKLQFHRIQDRTTGATTIVFGVRAGEDRLSFQYKEKDMMKWLKLAHDTTPLQALQFRNCNEDENGVPFFPDWILWKYYQKHRDGEVKDAFKFTQFYDSWADLNLAITTRRGRTLLHPSPGDFRDFNSAVLRQGNIVPPLAIQLPEKKAAPKKKVAEEPEPEQKAKRQKASPEPAAEEKPFDKSRRIPVRVCPHVLRRIANWRRAATPEARQQKHPAEYETVDTLSEKFGTLIETAPDLGFIFEDEPLNDEDHLRLLLLIITFEARFYPETPERLKAVEVAETQGKEFPPFSFDHIEPETSPPKPCFVVNYRMDTLTHAALRKAAEECNRVFEEAKLATKTGIDALEAWHKAEKPKRKLFTSGLTYDQIADGIYENPSWYAETIKTCWMKRKVSKTDLRRGATEYQNFNLLCLRYWEVQRQRETKKPVDAPIEEFVEDANAEE
jgi:hypothetical protein